MNRVAEVPLNGRTEGLISALTALWRCSVAASHHFLKDGDIDAIEPEARMAIAHIEKLYVAWTEEGFPAGFAGTQERKLEMLFVDAPLRGSGYGSLLMERALEDSSIEFVDVNEGNRAAARFYERKGFEVESRSEHDDAGRPYPLLHMRKKLA